MRTLKELMFQLNATDECSDIEAKKASEVGRSILETICAFSNEPNLGGGYILLGIEKDESSLFPVYTVTGIPFDKLDKIQSDLSSQCADSLNRTMRTLMDNVFMMLPTFESDRENNKLTVRLLLHHLLNEEDLNWLENFNNHSLTDNQKRILIFVREVGAIDNSSARQINGSEAILANYDLRRLREIDLQDTKGKNRFTYYLPTKKLKNTYIKSTDILISRNNSETSPDSLPTNLEGLPTNLVKIEEIKEEINRLPLRINDKSSRTGILYC